METVLLVFYSLSVNFLKQAFCSLSVDLKTDKGENLLLGYQCMPILLSHLDTSSKGLLSGALDGLYQMTTESVTLGYIFILNKDITI